MLPASKEMKRTGKKMKANAANGMQQVPNTETETKTETEAMSKCERQIFAKGKEQSKYGM